jgi:hypothetical protein
LAPSAHSPFLFVFFFHGTNQKTSSVLLLFLLSFFHFLGFSAPFEFFLHFVFCFSLFPNLSCLINSYLIFSIKIFNLLIFFFFFFFIFLALLNRLFTFYISCFVYSSLIPIPNLHFVFCFSLFPDLSCLINNYLIISIKIFNLLTFFLPS